MALKEEDDSLFGLGTGGEDTWRSVAEWKHSPLVILWTAWYWEDINGVGFGEAALRVFLRCAVFC